MKLHPPWGAISGGSLHISISGSTNTFVYSVVVTDERDEFSRVDLKEHGRGLMKVGDKNVPSSDKQ